MQIGRRHEAYIFRRIYGYQTHFSTQALNEGLFKGTSEAFDFCRDLEDYIIQGNIYAKDIIDFVKKYLLSAHEINRLDDFTIEGLGGLARVLTSKDYKSNKLVQESISDIVDLFGVFQRAMKKEHQTVPNFNQITKELGSIKDYLLKLNERSLTKVTVSKINKILKQK